MLALVPVWRPDAISARRLYGFTERLEDGDVVKAVEQVRFQRHGSDDMPPWLRALAGFALATSDGEPEWIESADEGEVLRRLQELLNSTSGPVVLFSGAKDAVHQLRLRLMLNGLPAAQSAHWSERFCDGQSWQTDRLRGDPDAARACLALAAGRGLDDPWNNGPLQGPEAMEQARVLRDLHQRGWM